MCKLTLYTSSSKAVRRLHVDRTKSSSHQSLCQHVRRTQGDGTLAVRSSCIREHSCTKSVQLHIPACVVGCELNMARKTRKVQEKLPPESEKI